jgi:hypothetical protein
MNTTRQSRVDESSDSVMTILLDVDLEMQGRVGPSLLLLSSIITCVQCTGNRLILHWCSRRPLYFEPLSMFPVTTLTRCSTLSNCQLLRLVNILAIYQRVLLALQPTLVSTSTLSILILLQVCRLLFYASQNNPTPIFVFNTQYVLSNA